MMRYSRPARNRRSASGWRKGGPRLPPFLGGGPPRGGAAETSPVRDEALRAHATQIDPASRWFAVPDPVQAELWPTEEYELARCLVDTTLPEDDLFSGVRERVHISHSCCCPQT